MPPNPLWQQRGGGEVDNLLTLIVLVSAEVLSHLIKKWLDKHLESDAHDSDDDADDVSRTDGNA